PEVSVPVGAVRAAAVEPERLAPVKPEVQRVPTVKNGFKQGMKLEGIDPQHPSMYFVLTVAEVCGYRLRLHFDGYSDCHDFWVNANSPDIHPAGWCESTGHKLHTPKGCKEEEFTWTNYLRMTKAQVAPKEVFASPGRVSPTLQYDSSWVYEPHTRGFGAGSLATTHKYYYPDPGQFSWSRYLEETGSKAVAADAFKVRPPHNFQPQMKLEAVDKRSPGLIRVATVEEVETHRIK
ncbi:hypothetical protein XENOCAPTIV_013835, partial [Xenoophorus captivus]